MAKDISELSDEDILYLPEVDARITEARGRISALMAGGQDDEAMDKVRELSEELAELREFSAAVRPANSVVRASYWDTYAKSYAYGIYGEVTETPYWKDKEFAEDLQSDYQEVTLHGVTFLWNGI